MPKGGVALRRRRQMDLKLIRKEINRIDDDMKKLFDARLDCSAQVASVKMKEHGEV